MDAARNFHKIPTASVDRPSAVPRTTLSKGSIAIYQDVVPHYRIGFFEGLARRIGEYTLYAEHFDAIPKGVRCIRCAGLGGRQLRLHPRPLISALSRAHAVFICEGRLKLLTSTLLALLGDRLRICVLWWGPIWRPNGRVEVGGGPRGWLVRRVLGSLHGYVTYGSKAAEVARAGGVSSDRIFVAYNSLDTAALADAERRWRDSPERLERFLTEADLIDKKVILFVGRVIPRKRLDALVEAFAELRREDSEDALRLVLIGDGPELRVVRALANRLGVSDGVLFKGRVVSVNEVCPFFLAARVVVLPGAGGLVVNQALTHGVPVIVGGGDGTEADAVQDGSNGYLWPGDTSSSLAELIGRVVYAPDTKWNDMSASARSAIRTRSNMDLMLDGMTSALVSASKDADSAQHPS